MKTGYARLHGEPARERVPQFGKTAYCFVPNTHRHRWDARWRPGVYLGRSWNSDQNYIGLSNGHVTRARGMVRLVNDKRWSRERLERITVTPAAGRPIALDRLEEDPKPREGPPMPAEHHAGVDPEPNPTRPKRLKIT